MSCLCSLLYRFSVYLLDRLLCHRLAVAVVGLTCSSPVCCHFLCSDRCRLLPSLFLSPHSGPGTELRLDLHGVLLTSGHGMVSPRIVSVSQNKMPSFRENLRLVLSNTDSRGWGQDLNLFFLEFYPLYWFMFFVNLTPSTIMKQKSPKNHLLPTLSALKERCYSSLKFLSTRSVFGA